MSNILLVTDSKSFMISSLAKQLEEQGHKIIFTQNDPSDISKIKEEVQMVLIYEEELDSEGLIYLKDKVIEESIPVFATGDTNQIAEIEKVIRPLLGAYREVSARNPAGPVMENSQSVYVGLTYGRHTLTENMADQCPNRGMFA